jgi:hypothetical protein
MANRDKIIIKLKPSFMLSLFRIFTQGKKKNSSECQLPSADISFSIFRNYLSRNKSDGEMNATHFINNEMASLEDALRLVDDDKRYDLIVASLRRIEGKLER